MKKFITLLCCLSLMFSLNCVSVFAAEETASPAPVETFQQPINVSDRATSLGLWYKENFFFMDTMSFTVTPEKGANLNIWMDNANTVGVVVYKTNMFGGYSQVYKESFGAGDRDVRVETKCNGKPYLVKFVSAIGGTGMSALVYQN